MTSQERIKKIAELEQCLKDNPNHVNRTTIEADLRKLKEHPPEPIIERDTFDLREYEFYPKRI